MENLECFLECSLLDLGLRKIWYVGRALETASHFLFLLSAYVNKVNLFIYHYKFKLFIKVFSF